MKYLNVGVEEQNIVKITFALKIESFLEPLVEGCDSLVQGCAVGIAGKLSWQHKKHSRMFNRFMKAIER